MEGAHELMIGSTAISLGFAVITSDMRNYGKIKGLSLERQTLTAR